MCKIDDCDNVPHGYGLCNKHYRNWTRYGDPTPNVGHKGKRRGCPPDCTCDRHPIYGGKKRIRRVDSLPCGYCGTVRKVTFCNGPDGKDPDKFCNRDCYTAWSTARKETRRSKTNVLYHYDMSMSEFTERLVAQEYKCAICGIGIDEKTAHRDHCHKTGEWRDLLCGGCNRGLGCFKDDPDRLMAAAFYLAMRTDVLGTLTGGVVLAEAGGLQH